MMELEFNKSENLFPSSGGGSKGALNSGLPIQFQLSNEKLASSLSYVTYTLVFILVLQFCSKSAKNKFKGKSGCDGCEDKEKVLGVDDIRATKPFLPLKLVGHIPLFLPYTEALKKALVWDRQYPGLQKIIGIGQTFVGLHSGPLIQQLFKSTDYGHGVKSPVVYDTMKPFITNGVLVSTGKFWHGQRRILMKTQSFQNLKRYIGMLNKHSGRFVNDLEKMFGDGKPHEINGLINTAFLKVITEMITGYDIHSSNEFDRYHHNFQIWKESLIHRILHPWLLLKPLWRLHPMSRKHDKAVHEMFEFAHKRIKEHRERRADKLSEERGISDQNYNLEVEGNVDPDKPVKFRSVLDELLDAGVDDTQIIDEVNTMLFGGHETGASAIHCFCFAMALHPEIQELCRNEVDLLFDDPLLFQNGEITYEAVQYNLKYVERCILETLRLFPPVFIFLRRLETPLKLDHDNRTYLLPKGTNVAILPYVIHRNPEYFPEPDKFDPDRFLPEEVAKRHAFAFVPFSGGQRSCLGMKFSMIEMKIVVAYLLKNFVMRTKDRMEDVPLLPFITLTPAKDFTFEFERRL